MGINFGHRTLPRRCAQPDRCLDLQEPQWQPRHRSHLLRANRKAPGFGGLIHGGATRVPHLCSSHSLILPPLKGRASAQVILLGSIEYSSKCLTVLDRGLGLLPILRLFDVDIILLTFTIGLPTPIPSLEPQGMPSFACCSPDDLFGNVQDLTYTTKISGTKPFAYGGYSDIWRGYEWGSGATRTVAIKIIRVATRQTVSLERLKKRISREITAWNVVGHQNILPFYGLFWPDGRDALPAMVYPYCEAGTCLEYLANNTDADRMAIIRQVTDGLHHLHSFNPPIAHGDIKAANILMKQDGTPLIADFGLSRLVMEFSTGLTTSSSRGSYRWMAPELFGGIDSYVLVLVTPASDVWAFGCLCIEILSGVIPWASTRNDAAVMLDVVKNRKVPPLPESIETTPIGHIMRHCWAYEPLERPSIAQLVNALVEIDPELLHTPTCILPQPSVSSDSPTFSDGPTPLESATVFPDQLVVSSTLPSTNEDVFNPSLWQMIGVDTPYNVHLLTGPSSQSLLPHHSHAAPSVPRNLHSPTSKPIQTSTATPDDRLVALTNHPSYPWQRPRIPNASRHGLKERMKEERHWQQDEATPARKEQPKHEILEEQRRPKRTKFCPDGGTSNVSISQIASSPQPTRPQKGKLIEHAALMPSFFVQTSPGSLEEPTLEDAPISMKMTVHEVIAHLVAHGCQDLTDAVDPTTFSEHPVSHGGFSDIYCGRLLNDSRVAIKTLRVSIGSIAENPKHFKHAARELHTWGKCLHPNVLQLYGLAVFRGRIGMVSPWQGQGSLPRYLERTPGVDRCNLCAQIGDGLSYLHQIGIIHGDLKGANVLVSDDGIPVLTDFGNSIYSDQSMRFTETTSSSSITVRWSAAELITGLGAHTEASDVYALAMRS
ncbi:hypothetical protein ACGC1H_002340 [Rhizoctonia solani]